MTTPKHLSPEARLKFGDLVEEGMKEDASVVLQIDDRIIKLEREISRLKLYNDEAKSAITALGVAVIVLCICIGLLAGALRKGIKNV